MFVIALSRAMTVAIVIVAASCGPRKPYTVGDDNFGPVTLGMSVKQAEASLGVRLQKDTAYDYEECRYHAPVKGYRGLSFMTSFDKIVRIDVSGSTEPTDPVTIATREGARTGDAEARVLKLYEGHIKVSPHFYGGLPAHYLRVYDGAGKVRLIFETDNEGLVTSFRAGREPEVEYVEGCS